MGKLGEKHMEFFYIYGKVEKIVQTILKIVLFKKIFHEGISLINNILINVKNVAFFPKIHVFQSRNKLKIK